MCGITGYWNMNGGENADLMRERITRMTNSMFHVVHGDRAVIAGRLYMLLGDVAFAHSMGEEGKRYVRDQSFTGKILRKCSGRLCVTSQKKRSREINMAQWIHRNVSHSEESWESF
jgi:hypothetical protein